MKLVLVLLALVAVASADPIGISDNKIGDIISADIDVNLVLTSNVEQNIMTIIAALLNQQAAVVGGDLPAADANNNQQNPMMSDMSKLITPENIEKVKSMLVKMGKSQE